MGTGAVLFDFFGTLVTAPGAFRPTRYGRFPRTVALLMGGRHGNAAERFEEVWDGVIRQLELIAVASHREFSMNDVVDAYDAAEQLGLDESGRHELVETYLTEWRAGIEPIAGVADLLTELRSRVKLAIVANTHDPRLVPELVDEYGLGPFDAVVLSVEHGFRKPHPSIFTAALDRLGVAAPSAIFVGDVPDRDYHGPRAVGLRALLIDPAARHSTVASTVAEHDRITSVVELLHHIER